MKTQPKRSLYPMLYLGKHPEKEIRVGKSIESRVVRFAIGPRSEEEAFEGLPYAMLTEAEGAALVKARIGVNDVLYRWAETPSSALEKALERIASLEVRVQALERGSDKPKASAKQAQGVAPPVAPPSAPPVAPPPVA